MCRIIEVPQMASGVPPPTFPSRFHRCVLHIILDERLVIPKSSYAALSSHSCLCLVKKYQLPAAHLLCINRKERGRVGFLLVVDFLKIFQSPILRNESRKGSSSSPSINISPEYLWVCPWSEMYLIADPVISFPSPVLPVIL